MINLPIFRAKKLDSDEYVEGCLLPKFENNYYISLEWSMDFDGYAPDFEKIDISTLSIHFPDMLDSQGNKIFASLQEDGKGGDIFILGDIRLKYIAMIRKNQLMAKQQGTYGSFIGQGYATVDKWKSIGIQQ